VIANRHRVPKKAWRRWSEGARHVFNELYAQMRERPDAFQAPAVERMKIAPRSWSVTAWNAAWIAADACDGR
jgi:hypothetical protein